MQARRYGDGGFSSVEDSGKASKSMSSKFGVGNDAKAASMSRSMALWDVMMEQDGKLLETHFHRQSIFVIAQTSKTGTEHRNCNLVYILVL